MDVTSEIVELRIPRKVSKSAQPSLIVAEEPCTIPRTVTTLKPAPAPNFAIPVVDRQQPRYDGRRQEQNVRRPWSFFHQEEDSRHHQQEERRHQEGRCHELERRHHDGRRREERCRQEEDRRRSQGDEERQCHHDGRRREEDGRRRQEEERCYLEWRRLREATRCQEEEKCRQERRLHA
ncbi:hypothetical protein MHU86_1312 [Fragilaria crotonensis]|nr:hypothetical protein MHU86_1312 [Fragilaria crotonensis]